MVLDNYNKNLDFDDCFRTKLKAQLSQEYEPIIFNTLYGNARQVAEKKYKNLMGLIGELESLIKE